MLRTLEIFKTLKKKTLSSCWRGMKANVSWQCWSYMLSPSSTHLHAIWLPIPYIPIGLGLWLVDILSCAIVSIIQVFHLLWCWVWLVSLWECLVFHLSWYEVTMVRIDAVVWATLEWWRWLNHHGMWCSILEVDTPGQHVLPRAWYGTACWLIRKALVSLSCWMSGTGMAIPTRPQGARGAWGYSVIPSTGKS
jgi:hypothetical protein